MKNIQALTVLLVLTIPLKAFSGNWKLEKINEGAEDVWVIDSKYDLIWLSDPLSLDAGNDGSDDFTGLHEKWATNYKLANNILFDSNAVKVDWNNDNTTDDSDLSGFSPVGTIDQPFTGTFNGSYDTIFNLWINYPGTGNTGLFGVIKGADIRQVGLENLRIQIRNANVGGLVGQSIDTGDPNTHSRIRNCFVKGKITLTEVSGDANGGGLLGMGQDILVQGCYAVASVKSGHTGNKVGGLAGSILGGSIEDCYANAWVSGAAEAGALIGYVNNTAGEETISNCYSSGSAVGDNPVSIGGFIGTITYGEVSRCHWNSESSLNDRAVGSAGSGLVLDITEPDSKAFADAANFPGWDFETVWEIGDQSLKTFVLEIDYKPVSVRDILNDGQGDFDPWNQERWSAWYREGIIDRTFKIDSTLRFAKRTTVWTPDLSKLLEKTPEDGAFSLFLVEGNSHGIEIDGAGLIIDARNPAYFDQTLDEAYEGGYNAMREAVIDRKRRRCFSFDQAYVQGKPSTWIYGFTLKGFAHGIKVAGTHNHPLNITDCVFSRNTFGTYFNGSNISIQNCQYLENGSGGVYNGSGSHHISYRNNIFRDNDYVWPSNDDCPHRKNYADILFDCSYQNLVENNQFLPSQASEEHYRAAITTYRNQGDRDNSPYGNIIRNNSIEGYSIAIHIGTRMGKIDLNDIADAGRDYGYDNVVSDNIIKNTYIGIKLNSPGNRIDGDAFENVRDKIVLHCIFYNLTETTIENQEGDSVQFWFTREDYNRPPYSEQNWFSCHEDRNTTILRTEKLIHVVSETGIPVFPDEAIASFILAPTLLLGDEMKDTPLLSKKPIDIAVGNFYPDGPGDELAVIWDEPIMNENGTHYYSITIYNSRGFEVYRSGRSTRRWGGIAAGDFLSNTGDEIAAFHAEALDGKYPVYIFRRGYRDPHRTIFESNTKRIQTLASGNFNIISEEEEIAMLFAEDSTHIYYIDPNSGWSSTTLLSSKLGDITGGNFDADPQNGDELAGIPAQNPAISYFRAGGSSPYAYSATIASNPWIAIGAGNFDGGNDGRDEIAVSNSVAISGVFNVEYYLPGNNLPFKKSDQDVLGVPIGTIDGGSLFIDTSLTAYDKAIGFTSEDYGSVITGWGDQAVVLPSLPQTTAIPVFWMNAEPIQGSEKKHFRVTPLAR
ncbi:GLUG motif-containing protein [Bacteroidota bacterium]